MTNFSKYGKPLLKKIKNLSEEVEDHPSEENIHAFRVAVKKIKALIRLLSWHFPELDQKDRKKLYKLFSISGSIREWQMLSREVRDSKLPETIKEEILQQVNHEERKACRNFRSNYKKSMPQALEELDTYLEDFFVKASKINTESYLHCINERITVNFKEKNSSAEAYHDLRKQIKELKYNRKFLEGEDRSSSALLYDPEFLNNAEVLLGQWHDAIVTASQLQSLVLKEEFTPAAKAAITRLKKAKEWDANSYLMKFKHDFNQ